MLGAAMAAVLVIGGVAPAQAQAMKMAVVDIQTAMVQSKAGQSIQKQVAEQRKALDADADKIEAELMAKQKTVTAEREKLSPEDFAKKSAEIQKKAMESSQSLQARDAQIKRNTAATMSDLARKLAEVANDVAKAGKYDLLLSRQAVVAAPGSSDITAEVIKALDAKVPDMKLKSDAAKPAAGKS
jgi:outer membrane protein